MQSKLLTITIPTWNRVKLLEELLSQLIAEIESGHLEEKIELLISNNGSDDTTEELVLLLKSKYSFITYHTNGVNKGARYNVLKCMELASSKYLILFGDDDRSRGGVLKELVWYLEKYPDTGTLYDSHIFKRNPFGNSVLSLQQLLGNFFYYLGNAGLFIVRTIYVKEVLKNHSYEFFSPTWPQTQIFILATEKNRGDEIRISDLNILTAGKHDEVMIYTCYYLWRTTYFDFIRAIEEIRSEITPETYLAAKDYFRKNITQLFFNILQCGVFLDTPELRKKTSKEIFKNMFNFSLKEKMFLAIAGIALILPSIISRSFSNLFIYITRGSRCIEKKNKFVLKEKEKRRKKSETSGNAIREFDFVNV